MTNFINGDSALLDHYIKAYGQQFTVKRMPPDFACYAWKDKNTTITLNVFDGIYTSKVKDNNNRNMCRSPLNYLLKK